MNLRNLFNKKKKNKFNGIAIDKLKSPEKESIYFDELLLIPFDTTEEIFPNEKGDMTCTRVKNNNGVLTFRITMKKGRRLHSHFHDCEETIIVYQGSIINEIDRNIKSSLQIMKIPSYTDHIIKALEDTIFYVEFRKNKK